MSLSKDNDIICASYEQHEWTMLVYFILFIGFVYSLWIRCMEDHHFLVNAAMYTATGLLPRVSPLSPLLLLPTILALPLTASLIPPALLSVLPASQSCTTACTTHECTTWSNRNFLCVSTALLTEFNISPTQSTRII